MTTPLGLAGRAVMTLLAIGLGGASVGRYSAFDAERTALLQELRGAGTSLRMREARRQVQSEPEAAESRLIVAWALLGEAFDPDAMADRTAARLERQERALRRAAALATDVFRERPAAWQAPLVLGGSAYLIPRARRDAALYAAMERWEEPLRAAVELAPGLEPPRRLLAAAYLDVWFALSHEKRAVARELLRSTFARSLAEFDRLFEPWLEVAADEEEALQLVPSLPRAWEHVQRIFVRRGEWERCVRARGRFRSHLADHLQSLVAGAALLVERREADAAVQAYLDVLAEATPDLAHVAPFTTALARLPGGAVSPALQGRLAAWRDFTIDLALCRENPLPAEALGRVMRLSGEGAPHLDAVGAVLLSDLPRADRAERQGSGTNEDLWAPYRLLRARQSLDRGDAAAAAEQLARVPSGWRLRLPYQMARRRLEGMASGGTGHPDPSVPLRAHAWPATRWRLDGRSAFLELLPDAPGTGLEMLLISERPSPGIADVSWDGRVVASVAAEGPRSLVLSVDVTPEPHLLEVRSVIGERIIPGEVSVRSP